MVEKRSIVFSEIIMKERISQGDGSFDLLVIRTVPLTFRLPSLDFLITYKFQTGYIR